MVATANAAKLLPGQKHGLTFILDRFSPIGTIVEGHSFDIANADLESLDAIIAATVLTPTKIVHFGVANSMSPLGSPAAFLAELSPTEDFVRTTSFDTPKLAIFGPVTARAPGGVIVLGGGFRGTMTMNGTKFGTPETGGGISLAPFLATVPE